MYMIEIILLAVSVAILLAFLIYGLRSDESCRRQAYWARYEGK